MIKLSPIEGVETMVLKARLEIKAPSVTDISTGKRPSQPLFHLYDQWKHPVNSGR